MYIKRKEKTKSKGRYMKKTEENKFSMFKSVYEVLKENKDAFAEIPAFAVSFGGFEKCLNDISHLDNKYATVSVGKARDKEIAQEELLESLVCVGGILYIAGRNKKDENIKATSNVTFSGLKRLRDNDILRKAKLICDNAKSMTEFLKTLHTGIDSEITALDERITKYDLSINSKETKNAESHAARAALDKVIENADEILNEEFDNLIEVIRGKNPDIFNKYKSARVTKDLGYRKKKEETIGNS
jgi:hypothetical protein